MIGVQRWQLLGKVPLQSLRAGIISLLSNEDNLEFFGAAKN